CLAPVDQIKGLPIDFGAVMRQGDEGRVELLDDTIDAGVARHGPTVLGSDRPDLPMNRRRAGWWALQSQAFDQLLQLGSDPPMLAAIGAGRTDEPGEPVRLIPRDPALGSPQRDVVFARHLRERRSFLQRRA